MMEIYEWCALVTLISAFVSCGFSIQAVMAARGSQRDSLVTAQYALSRSVAIALVAIGLFIFKNNQFLIAMAIIMIAIQFFDGLIGRKISRFKTVGPLLTAAANAIILILFLIA
ncbi:hypothetical protein [Lacticaseibacillus brantae]|uniref:Integral membrane protein n=1 Tax=Lacticaseibacillus brantae DSM 23927 TaxID=1423727 RepID=A0A0R2AYT6_9LACO|nr:hypothetical protein [Lacticaseibacillus brantae]KRM72111.1 hypothetical protein FC34_GL001095 [Lacticaseibacillus brantae DSM 23927]